MAGFGSGLAHALTAGLTGYGAGQEDARQRQNEQMKQMLLIAAQKRAEERDQQDMELRRLSTIGSLAAQGLDITPSTPPATAPAIPAAAVPDTASARAVKGQNPTSPESGEANPMPAQASDDGTVIGALNGMSIKVPAGGPQSKAVRDAQMKAKDRLQRLQTLNDQITDPKQKKTLPQLMAIAQDDGLYNQFAAQATGVARDPLALHQAMRDYDVAHPTRDVTGDNTSWQTVTTADGQMVQVNPKTGATRPIGLQGKTAAGGAGGAPTAAMRGKIAEIETNVGTIDEALTKLAAHKNAVGLGHLRGVSDILDQWADPKGVDARAALASVSSNLLHALSGAAVSPSEYERLRQYVPTSKDTYDAAVTKLTRLKSELARSKMNLEGVPADGARTAPLSAASEDQRLWDAAVAKYGKDRVLKEYGPRPQ